MLPRCQGHRQQGHHDRQRRVRRPQHDPELQERRHRHRGSRQHRVQLRDLLGLARARRQGHPDGRLHLSGRRRSSLRSHRYSGAAAGPDRPRHRRRRRHLARHARGRDGWIDHRPRCDHWSRRGRGRRDSGVLDRHRNSRQGHARSPEPGPGAGTEPNVRDRRHRRAGSRSAGRGRRSRAHGADAAPSRPGRRGQHHAARRRPRHAPPRHRRSRRRPAADPQRDRRHQDRRQRRDLQLPRAAAASSKATATAFTRATPTSKSSFTPTSNGARSSSCACAACSRWRSGTAARAR